MFRPTLVTTRLLKLLMKIAVLIGIMYYVPKQIYINGLRTHSLSSLQPI
jgi:hypothetical protein